MLQERDEQIANMDNNSLGMLPAKDQQEDYWSNGDVALVIRKEIPAQEDDGDDLPLSKRKVIKTKVNKLVDIENRSKSDDILFVENEDNSSGKKIGLCLFSRTFEFERWLTTAHYRI